MIRKRSFRRGRLSNQVVSEIEHMVQEEFREPGSRLPVEDELAERFGVSRIVVREAVKILEERGVVEVQAGRGTTTVAPSPDHVKAALLRLFRDRPMPRLEDMELLLELRSVLEETAAGLAAVRAGPEDLERIEAALLKMADESSEAETMSADLSFHMELARASHNPYFEIVVEPLTHVLFLQIQLTNAYNAIGIPLHRDILDQVRAGNAVGARQAVRRLMRYGLCHLREAFKAIEAAKS